MNLFNFDSAYLLALTLEEEEEEEVEEEEWLDCVVVIILDQIQLDYLLLLGELFSSDEAHHQIKSGFQGGRG